MPKVGGFLGVADVMTAMDGLDPGTKAGFFKFQGDGVGMRIGDQGDGAVLLFEPVQEWHHMGVDADQVFDPFLEAGDVHFQNAGPMVEVVPGQGSLEGFVDGEDFRFGLREGDPFFFGMGLGNRFPEEYVVEMKVQKRSVHVQEHRGDDIPGEGDDGMRRMGHDR